MSTLELIRNDNVMTAILNVVVDAGFDVLEANRTHVKVREGCLPVNISWGMCTCHGGRLWFSQDDTNIYIELSSAEYDTENGIVSPETELAWRIDNELADTVRGFKRFVYVVDTIGEYGEPNRRERKYFDSADRAALHIFQEGGHDIYTTEEVVHMYHNKDMRFRVTYDYDEGERNGMARRIHFRCEELKRKDDGPFEVDYAYEQVFWVYRKGLS